MSESNHRAVLPGWMVAADLLLLAGAFVLNILVLTDESLSTYPSLAVLSNILVILSGAYYCFSGYKKNGALFFKIFVYAFSLHHLFILVALTQVGSATTTAFGVALCYGLLTVLAASLNPGRRRSHILAGLVFLLQAADFICFLLTPSVLKSSQIYVKIADLLLAVLLNICIHAKYRDKENRHRPV